MEGALEGAMEGTQGRRRERRDKCGRLRARRKHFKILLRVRTSDAVEDKVDSLRCQRAHLRHGDRSRLGLRLGSRSRLGCVPGLRALRVRAWFRVGVIAGWGSGSFSSLRCTAGARAHRLQPWPVVPDGAARRAEFRRERELLRRANLARIRIRVRVRVSGQREGCVAVVLWDDAFPCGEGRSG